mmetsp:Transcript_9820/g.17081  ORF Transcript_9820/g.17081 Transcript_9820/m.17081 type:complete len:105 (-) Transcript_9820:453-767(-)
MAWPAAAADVAEYIINQDRTNTPASSSNHAIHENTPTSILSSNSNIQSPRIPIHISKKPSSSSWVRRYFFHLPKNNLLLNSHRRHSSRNNTTNHTHDVRDTSRF